MALVPGGGISRALQPREERIRTLLPARMRSQSGWSEACILNVSTGGMLVYSAGAAQPGTHVEVRRGRSLIIANVVWRKNQRMGLSSHQPVPIRDVLEDDKVAAIVGIDSPVLVERRRQPRSACKSRQQGRAMEFAALAAIGMLLATTAAVCVAEAVSTPIAAVRAALGSH